MSPADPWKWKWSGKCRKSEISLIWCISTTNNVKSCKKFNETAQTANFTDFSLTSCEYRPKWTKTMQTQTRRVRLQNFLRGIQICHMKADVLAIPKMWWFLILHFFKPKLLLPKVGSNLMNYFGKIAVLKKKTRLQFWVLTSDMNRTWKVPCETHVLFIWRLEIKICSRVFFF